MGGINSGRRPIIHNGTVEGALFLDMRALRRLGHIRPGECTYDTLRWSNGALIVAEARVSVDLSDIDNATIRITAEVPGGAVKQRIAIEAIDCRFGGRRFYFLCPIKGHRCEVLYFADGHFASRKAQDLIYAVQGMDRLARTRRRRRKLRDRLDGKGLLARPRGSRRYVIVERLRQAIKEERATYADVLRRIVENDVQARQKDRSGSR